MLWKSIHFCQLKFPSHRHCDFLYPCSVAHPTQGEQKALFCGVLRVLMRKKTKQFLLLKCFGKTTIHHSLPNTQLWSVKIWFSCSKIIRQIAKHLTWIFKPCSRNFQLCPKNVVKIASKMVIHVFSLTWSSVHPSVLSGPHSKYVVALPLSPTFKSFVTHFFWPFYHF